MSKLKSLKGSKEFRKTRRIGNKIHSKSLLIYVTKYKKPYKKPYEPACYVGIVISKKTIKLAVKRNKARRRLKEAIRETNILPVCNLIIIPKAEILELDFIELKKEIGKTFSKIDFQGKLT